MKSKRILTDRAHAIVMEDIAAEDWHEQLLVTVARSRISNDTRTKTFTEGPSGAHTEDVEEGRA